MKKTLALMLLLAGLTLEARAETLTWVGDNPYPVWVTMPDYCNWLDEAGNKVYFQDGDEVVFKDLGSGNVDVYVVFPGNILVENSSEHDYLFAAKTKGHIGGNTGLTKKGDGQLTINVACKCDYSGGTYIYGGSIGVATGDEAATREIQLGTDDIHLYGGCLVLDSDILTNNIVVEENGTLKIHQALGNVTLRAGSHLKLADSLYGVGGDVMGGDVILGDSSSLDLGWKSVNLYSGKAGRGSINVEGNATIGNGEISLCQVNVEEGKTLTLGENTSATSGTVFNLGEGATLDLGGNSVNFVDASISASGNSAGIGNGTITGDLTVAAGKQITLLADTTITGGVTLGDNASLNLGKNAISASVTLSGSSATIGNGTVEGGLTVAGGKSLVLLAGTTITGDVSLEDGATFNLGGGSLSSNVSLGWDTTIGGGTLNGEISFAGENQQLSLCGDLGGTGDIAIGVVNKNSSSPIGIDPPHPVFTSTLDMGGHTLSKGLKLDGDTTVSNGRLVLAHDMTRSLDDIQARTVTIGAETTVDLNSHTFSHNLAVEADTAIGNGTIGGNVTVKDGKSVRFFGETKIDSNNKVGEGLVSYNGLVEAGKTKIQALHRPLESQIGAPVYPGLLQELSVSDGLIAGTDRQSSLAAGLEIESTANLMIKSMTITADNKISVGQNTITLNNVTIKISADVCTLVNGIYTIDLHNLINCDLAMENVLLDASELTLPGDFDPAKDAVAFDFGDDVTIKQATGLDMRLGSYWSQSMGLDEQGKVIFTKLVDTPEPTTGTLSLLGLGLLAARRRRK